MAGNRQAVLTNACAKAGWHNKLYCIAAGGHEVTLDKPISLPEARFNASMAFLSGGITISGDDPRRWYNTYKDPSLCVDPLSKSLLFSP